jgi:hypothetical protein
MRKVSLLLSCLACLFLLISSISANAQKKNDKLEEYRDPIPTPAETNHILVTYRLDGARGICNNTGKSFAFLDTVPP